MTLIEKLNEELDKVGLEFKASKELREKFKGMLVDKNTGEQIPYEVQKVLQWNMIPTFVKMSREHLDLYIKISNMQKKEEK